MSSTEKNTPDRESTHSAAWGKQQERGNMLALKLITWIALRFGRTVSRWVLVPTVAYFFLSSPLARRSSRQYLSSISGQSSNAVAVFRHLYTFACVTLDRIYFLNGRSEEFDVSIEDSDNQALQTASSGVGLILMGAHLGSFESVRTIAKQYPQLKMVLLMYEENAKNIKQLLKAINPEAQQSIISLGRPGVMLQVNEQLNEGALIGVLADRSLDDDGNLKVDFLQRQAAFPMGPFRMAAMLKRPVYFMAGIYQGGNRYKIYLEMIMDFSVAGLNREQATQDALKKYVQLIEKHCEASPYNWFNFYDFWLDKNKTI